MKITCKEIECEQKESLYCKQGNLCAEEYIRQITSLTQELQEKERQILEMRNCMNCSKYECEDYLSVNNCKQWEAIKG